MIRSLVRKFTAVGFLLASTAFISLWFLSPTFALLFFHSYAYLNYLRLMDVELFSMVINNILFYMLLGLQSFRLNGILNIFMYATGYGLIIPFLLVNSNLIRIIFAWIAGYYATIFLLCYVHSKVERPAPADSGVPLSPVLSYSIPVFISGVVSYGATYVDRFIVSFLINLSELGIYNFSLVLTNAISILLLPFTSVLLSRLSEFYGRGDRESFRLYSLKASEVLTAIYIPVALLVASLSPSILLFLANINYIPRSVPMIIIFTASSLTVSVNIFAVTLQAIRKTRFFIASSSLGLISNVILSIILIPRIGIDGAAIGYASTGVASFIVIYHYARKYGTFVFERVKMLKIYASGIVMFILTAIVQERLGYSILKLFVYIVTGLEVYLFSVRVLETFDEGDIDLFLGMIPGSYRRVKRFIRSLFV